MQWAMRGNLRFFRYVGADIFTTPPPFDHAKLCTVDGAWCLIGSSNWDARSLRLNFEFDLECSDAALTGAIDALIDARIARGAAAVAGKPGRRTAMAAPAQPRRRDLLMPYL